MLPAFVIKRIFMICFSRVLLFFCILLHCPISLKTCSVVRHRKPRSAQRMPSLLLLLLVRIHSHAFNSTSVPLGCANNLMVVFIGSICGLVRYSFFAAPFYDYTSFRFLESFIYGDRDRLFFRLSSFANITNG